MQQNPEEELTALKKRLAVTEEERERFQNELREMKKKVNQNQTTAMSNGKVTDVFSELNSAMESLSKSNEQLKIKESAIKSLKAELEKAKQMETKLAEKDSEFEKLKLELDNAQSSETRVWDLLSKSKERIYELESEVEKRKESETKILDSFAVQTKQLEQTKILLEESKLQVSSLNGDESVNQSELESLKSELGLLKAKLARAEEDEKHFKTNLVKENEMLKHELKQAMEVEENSKKAMDDLAFALKEVATEANQTKEKLMVKQVELENLKKESEELKEKFRKSDRKLAVLLDEARKQADMYRNTADRLRLEAEEALQAWNGKETGFVDCIRIAEDEKMAAQEENAELVEALEVAENKNKKAKEENQKLRDILKQALSEANSAKEAAGIATYENSQMKDLLAEKDDALNFITRENEKLRFSEAAAMENIKELKRLLAEVSGKESQEHKLKPQNSADKDAPKRERRLSNAFSLNLKDLISHTLNGYTHDQDHKTHEKHNEIEKDEYPELADSPVAARTHHHRIMSSSFAENGEGIINPDELEHLDGVRIDDVENEKNPKKKKALLRRLSEIIIRRRGVHGHRRESSIGGDNKKDLSVVGEGKATSPSSGDNGHKKESLEFEFGGQSHQMDSE